MNNDDILLGAGGSAMLNVKDWIQLICKQLPSKSAYIESAIDLALEIVKHICQTVGSSSSKLNKLVEHITSDKIAIFVDHASLSTINNHSGSRHAPKLTGIRFQFEISGVHSLLSTLNITSPEESSFQRKICVELGKVLLELFSGGQHQSGLAKHSDENLDNSASFSQNSNCTQQSSNQSAMLNQPVGKRQVTLPTNNGSKSSIAKNLLLDMGAPLSVCQLVCDLLDAEENESSSFSLDDDDNPKPLTSVKGALWDLTLMKAKPHLYLYDRTNPRQALQDTCLFGNASGHLFGREMEYNELMDAKNLVAAHVNTKTNETPEPWDMVLYESVFLSGYAGSGKSALMHSLVKICNDEKQWFVLGCKFDKKAAPHMILAKAFDDFFGKWGDDAANNREHPLMESFQKICRTIFVTVDSTGCDQLCDIIPNFVKFFPLFFSSKNNNARGHDELQSMDKVGSAKKRLQYLFHVLFKALCSGGHPVLFTLDDMQWSGSCVMEYLQFVLNHDTSALSQELSRQGIFFVGTYRSNELVEGDGLMKSINLMKESGRANVTLINVGELEQVDITELISAKLCLPLRYTNELARLVHSKTRGNPFHINQFMRCIIQNKMLQFSVKSRRWEWDNDVVDMQMISEGVAGLLTSTFSQLPSALMQTVKIISCLGSQVEEATIDSMNSKNEVLSFDMHEQLKAAVKEGILEKAGPLYQFTHDIIQQTIYDLIPYRVRHLLHKAIGESLLNSAESDPSVQLLAVDQINLFCKDGTPSPEERFHFAQSNAKAAKMAVAASSFEQAQSYVDTGMKLIGTSPNHWSTHYRLSLQLFELSASVSMNIGSGFVDTSTTISTCLDQILTHARTFEDSLVASGLLVKLLLSKSKFEEARTNCIAILSSLGEIIPLEVDLPLALNELSATQLILRNITYDQMKSLPLMIDSNKKNVMQFLNVLCRCSVISKPTMLPFLASRMVKLMFEYGMCDDGIVGFVTVGYSVFQFTEDISLASHIGKVGDRLVEDSPRKHALRSRLCNELHATLRMISEPWHACLQVIPELYKSAMLSGDVENGLILSWTNAAACLWFGMDLSFTKKVFVQGINEVARYQHTLIYVVMTNYHPIANLTDFDTGKMDVEIRSLDELNQLGEKTNSSFLLWQTFMCRMNCHFWTREYEALVKLSEKFSNTSQPKRMLKYNFGTFFEGIAYSSLARDTKQQKYKALAEKALSRIVMYEREMCSYNFHNKTKLLQAEVSYLNGNLIAAEMAYKESIASAKFMHEEALAYELFGIFYVENKLVAQGLAQLKYSLEKYAKWGATKKVRQLNEFVELVKQINTIGRK